MVKYLFQDINNMALITKNQKSSSSQAFKNIFKDYSEHEKFISNISNVVLDYGNNEVSTNTAFRKICLELENFIKSKNVMSIMTFFSFFTK